MRTNIVLNDQLTTEAFLLTGLKTKRELIDFALRELIRMKKQETTQGLCTAFKTLHQLKLNNNPFPEVKRQNRPNPFANEL
ncbi:MAG: type II toxin-antitoxin system VapB family antitoxin [Aquificaceae bacterium]|nr:MAG: type II toxin-antitoxin system VapB family antitoxin [Aquificaceae bacterium]